jgi:hypothetical protein
MEAHGNRGWCVWLNTPQAAGDPSGPPTQPRYPFYWEKWLEYQLRYGHIENLNDFSTGIQLKRQMQKCGFA